MKRVYEKPMVAIEHFTLAQSIAVSCGYTHDKYFGSPAQGDKLNCGWNNGIGEVYWIVGTTSNCTLDTDADAIIGDKVCYNEPAGGAQIFAS